MRRLFGLTAAIATAGSLLTAPAVASGSFFGYQRPALHEVRSEAITVPLRDGSHLACRLHRPAEASGEPVAGRFPGIVYDFNAYDNLDQLAAESAYFVRRGYNVLSCNTRGSGDSPGRIDPFSAQEQTDNHDIIEWLAARPWSTGRIGQIGVSYGGHAALLAATRKPPHLETIIPVNGISDWYENTIYRGGIYSARIRDWQRQVAPDTLRTYAEHPLYDDFWRERSVKDRWSDLDIPVLEINGWNDRYRGGMVENFQARKQNVWLVSGPWEHGWPAGQPAGIGPGEYLAWFDRWLGGRKAPLPPTKVTSYAMHGTGWQSFADWPPARGTRYALTTAGELARSAGAPGTGGYRVNTETTPAEPGEKLTFTAPPQRRDLVLAGDPKAEIEVSVTAADGNLAAVLEDVAPDGTATRITAGWLKLSHRHGHTAPVEVHSGQWYRTTVDLWPVHHRLAAGHTMRLTVSSDDHPEIDSDAPPGNVALRLGAGGSALVVPS
ncbi:CocE/NonD family hydrolase [Amycolatopsis sp. YIM 10]|uniref:CocE/NonD family hydrolase n=1 Tax=Amycolatopsis sp. YIM 10 TaxID=2653857 RepID=UPI00128FDD59|nr:CocE/NonD family hydrolase [Amycolatopsis sp. YIM 10]QFU89390.1 Cocaine esterase [Amycolatopsis sp. YIM 10]